MKVYQITRKENSPNVFGISLVRDPAMQSNYVMLSKDRTDHLTVEQKIHLSNQNDVKFSKISEEKRLLMGLVLEPDKLIYRYDQQTKEEYYITVSAETILELQQDYIKKSNQNYSTLEHDGKELEGISFTEHWIVEDSKIDKSALHGLSFKVGSWVTVAKIDNEKLWNDYIKTGNVLGFSIDAMVHLEEINLNKQEMSEQKTVIELIKDLPNQIKVALYGHDKDEDKMKKAKMEEHEDDKVKKAGLDKHDEEEKAKMEEHVDPDGNPAPIDTPLPSDADHAMEMEDMKSELSAIKEALATMGVEFANIVKDALKPIEEANVNLKKEVETLNTEVVELGRQPASNPIHSAPAQVNYSEMSNRQKMEYNKNK
jgi:hypothetical protein